MKFECISRIAKEQVRISLTDVISMPSLKAINLGVNNEIACVCRKQNKGLDSLPACGLKLSEVEATTDPIFSIYKNAEKINKNEKQYTSISFRLKKVRYGAGKCRQGHIALFHNNLSQNTSTVNYNDVTNNDTAVGNAPANITTTHSRGKAPLSCIIIQ